MYFQKFDEEREKIHRKGARPYYVNIFLFTVAERVHIKPDMRYFNRFSLTKYYCKESFEAVYCLYVNTLLKILSQKMLHGE